MINVFKDKNILISNCNKMLAAPLVKELRRNHPVRNIYYVPIDNTDYHIDAIPMYLDLTVLNNCIEACAESNYVFHLEGIQGNVATDLYKSAEYFVTNTATNVNMLEAARRSKIERYVFCTVYAPKPRDDYAAWHKDIGEMQCRLYRDNFHMNTCVARFASIYGPYDNFGDEGKCVPSLIKKICTQEIVKVWGDGSATRDFLYADDCASTLIGIMHFIDSLPLKILDVCSGTQTSIKNLVDCICEVSQQHPEIVWEKSQPIGSQTMKMDPFGLRDIGHIRKFDLRQGITKTIEHFLEANKT